MILWPGKTHWPSIRREKLPGESGNRSRFLSYVLGPYFIAKVGGQVTFILSKQTI